MDCAIYKLPLRSICKGKGKGVEKGESRKEKKKGKGKAGGKGEKRKEGRSERRREKGKRIRRKEKGEKRRERVSICSFLLFPLNKTKLDYRQKQLVDKTRLNWIS